MLSKDLKEKYPIGITLEGKVAKHMPFGVFIKLEEEEKDCLGLVSIINIGKSGVWNLQRLPTIGESVKVQVIGYTEDNRKQVWLKPIA